MRGYVDIIAGRDDQYRFAVMDRNASGDSGWIVGGFPTRQDAVSCAARYAQDCDKRLHTARIFAFPVRGAPA